VSDTRSLALAYDFSLEAECDGCSERQGRQGSVFVLVVAKGSASSFIPDAEHLLGGVTLAVARMLDYCSALQRQPDQPRCGRKLSKCEVVAP
jgi:hypothetical protein